MFSTPMAWARRSIFRVETPLKFSDDHDQCLPGPASLQDEERHVAALPEHRHEDVDRSPSGIHPSRPGPGEVGRSILADLPLAAQTLASDSILIISFVIHLSMARKGPGSLMNCNSAFLKDVLYCCGAIVTKRLLSCCEHHHTSAPPLADATRDVRRFRAVLLPFG